MALLEQDHAFEIADAIIAASGSDETEVSIGAVEDRFVRFAADGPTQSADRERYEVKIRVRFRHGDAGIAEASASCGSLDEDSVFQALDRALVLARVAGPDASALPLAGPAAVEGTSPSRPTQDHTFREKAEWIGAAMDAADERSLTSAGLARTTVEGRSLVTSAGRRVHGATSRSELSVSMIDAAGAEAGASASGSSIDPYVDQIDAPKLAAEVADAAALSRDAVAIEPVTLPVVLEPAAVAALMTFASYSAFGAREVAEGSSFMAGREGEHLFGEMVTIADDVQHPMLRGFRFDGEGSPRQRALLVEEGRIGRPVTDQRWAARLNQPNTGHGAPQPSGSGPYADAVVVGAGDGTTDELLSAVGDGLYIRQFHYVNMVEPQDLVLTGLTRGGVFRIRGGQVAEPVQDLRFTQSLVSALRDVVLVGAESRRSRSLMGPEVVAPALAIRNFAFTSRAGGA